jgi:hypothetical protein
MLFILFLFSSVAYCGEYDTAISKAQEALYIQSGLSGTVDTMRSGLEREANFQLKRVGIQKEVGVAGGLLKIVRDRSVSIPLRDKRLTIQPDRVTISICI